MTRQYFFMVYMEDGHAPTYRHATINLAEEEAKRLAKKFNKKTYVLCSLKSFEISEFVEKNCKPEIDDLPF